MNQDMSIIEHDELLDKPETCMLIQLYEWQPANEIEWLRKEAVRITEENTNGRIVWLVKRGVFYTLFVDDLSNA